MTDSLTIFGDDFTGVTGIKATGTGNGTLTYIRPAGTKSISSNGTGIDVTNYASVNVAVPSSSPNLQAKTNINPTISSQTIQADSGYDGLSSVQINAMPTGTEGTPTATKGSVSNHAISVTPFVTNVAGYISGGTHTGTAVSVQASELVSGTYTVDSSGTKDVTNYASASVASGSRSASATKGTVSNHSVSVTPTATTTAGYLAAGSTNGTAVTVSASELVSGSETKTANGTYDVTNLAQLVVDVQGGSGGGLQIATTSIVNDTTSSSLYFENLLDEPTSFMIIAHDDLSVTTNVDKIATVVWDGTNLVGQKICSTSNAQVTYLDVGVSYNTYNNTLYVSGYDFQAIQYDLIYTYDSSAGDIDTKEVQVGSGATSIAFTGLDQEPDFWYLTFKSNFSTSSGYQRVIAVVNDGGSIRGLEMDSGAHYSDAHWSANYSNGTLTISSQNTNAGGYFHQPGYYQLVYGNGEIEPVEIEVVPLSVTQNGTYTAPSNTAYSPVTVNVSGGGVNVDQVTWTNSSTSTVSHQFTSLKGTPKFAVLRCTAQLTRSSSNTYYYIADIVWDGTDAYGNYHLRSNGSYNNVAADAASGFNVTVGTNSITFSSDATSRSAAPGSFYNSTYEMTYVY